MIDQAELLFIGTTYVYRGEYPRRDGKPWDRTVYQRPRHPGIRDKIIGTGLERSDEPPPSQVAEQDRLSPEERTEMCRRNRGGESQKGKPRFSYKRRKEVIA